MEIKDVKMREIGNTHYLPVPKAFIKNGLLDKDKKYNIIIEEVEG